MFRRIKHILIKEFIQVLRDHRLRKLIFLPPLVQLVIYGYAVNFDFQHIRTAIFDEDRTPISREFINRLSNNQYFNLVQYLNDEDHASELIDQGYITLLIHIPPAFTKNIKNNHPTTLQLIVDGSDSNQALVIMRYINIIINNFSQDLFKEYCRKKGLSNIELPINIEQRIFYNENLISHWSFVPGIIAMVVMLVSLMLTALAIVREKELGTIEQLLLSPLNSFELILGKTLPFVIIALIDACLVTIVGVFWFEVPLRGSLFVLALGIILFLFNSVGVGLLISTFSSTQQQAMTSSHFIITPAFLLSGLIFPIANMPNIVQYITFLNPLRYFIIIIRGIFLKGITFDLLLPEITGLALLGFCLFIISIIQFQRRLF